MFDWPETIDALPPGTDEDRARRVLERLAAEGATAPGARFARLVAFAAACSPHLAQSMARETASFMKFSCLRTDWPREATACSALRSGSARRIATSVIADDRKRRSCA